MSMYPHVPKVESFSNAVDVVERLRDPTDPSTERTAPPRSAHIQLRRLVPSTRRRGDDDDVLSAQGFA